MIGWSKYPFVRLIIPFIAGIALSKYVYTISGIHFVITLILLFALTAFLLLPAKFTSYSNRWIHGVSANLAALLLGYVLTCNSQLINIRQHFANLKGNPELFVARVIDEPVEKERSFNILLKTEEVMLDGQKVKVTGKILCRILKDTIASALRYGDVVVFDKIPQPPDEPGNPGEFNYKSYLADNGIFHTIFLKSNDYKLIDRNRGSLLKSFALVCRQELLDVFKQKGMNDKELAVAIAILAGYDQLLDKNNRLEYSNAGVIHVLCVSGLHVGIIYMLAEMLLIFIKKWHKISFLRPILIIAVIWLYALITGLAPPVLRAALMFTFILLGTSLQKQSNRFNTLAAVAFILLVIDPMSLFNIGFQLSFSAVAGIMLFNPFFNKLWHPINPLLKYTWDMISISTAAQLMTLPLILFYFHRFPSYFLIANLIAIPLSGFIIYAGLTFLVTFSVPLIGKVVFSLLLFLIRLLNNSVAYIDNLPGAVINNIYMPFFATAILFGLIIFTFLFLKSARKEYLFAIIVCGVILAGNSTFHHIKIHKQRKIIFHKSALSPLVSFISGHNQSIICDSIICVDNTPVSYQLDGLTSFMGIEMREWHALSTLNSYESKFNGRLPEFYSFEGKKLVFICGPGYIPEYKNDINIDYVILIRNPLISAEQLKKNFPGAVIIADNTCSTKMLSRYKQNFSQIGMKIFNLKEQGALVVDLGFK